MASFRARTLNQSLDPADLTAAVQAFEAGLRVVEDTMDGVSAYDLRQALARHVIEHALNGERDPAALTAAAIGFLELTASRRRSPMDRAHSSEQML